MLPDLFMEVVRFCVSLGVVGLGHITFDGCVKIQAETIDLGRG